MAKSRIEFVAVVGSGNFPWDGLRYDFSSPASELDTHNIIGPERGSDAWLETRVVVVKRIVARDVVGGDWTPARWESFGWRMVFGGTKNGFDNEHDARRAGGFHATMETMKAKGSKS
jgi:hypothetical protein